MAKSVCVLVSRGTNVLRLFERIKLLYPIGKSLKAHQNFTTGKRMLPTLLGDLRRVRHMLVR